MVYTLGVYMICAICDEREFVKNGMRHGRQSFKCKKCGYQCSKENSRKSLKDIQMAVALYAHGFSFRTIAKLFSISPNTVMLWVRNFSELHNSKPKVNGEIEVEIDEMWHFIELKKTNCGFGRHFAEQLKNFWTGNAARVKQKHFKNFMTD